MSNQLPHIDIAGRRVGSGHPVYIVAELSANHRGDVDEAIAIIDAAKGAGADAIKLQTYTADTLTIDCRTAPFRIDGTLWNGRYLHELYREASTPWEWHQRLREEASGRGLDFFSTAFDETSVDFLLDLDVPAFKVASFELVDIPLLRKVAQTGRPVILSTGMATLSEIEEAVTCVRSAGGAQLALLHCSSAYPAPFDALHLRTLPHLGAAFEVPVGLSDHTLGTAVPIAAVALGACIIEKHLTLSRAGGGADAAFSLEPREFKDMVDGVRAAERALGRVHYGPSDAERGSRAFRRSLFVVEDMKAGDTFTLTNVRSIRPAGGLHTRHRDQIVGQRAARDLPRGTPLCWELVLRKDAVFR